MAKSSRGIQSIEVGGRLLQAIADSSEPMMLRDLAATAQMAAGKAHPYLASFMRMGLIEQDATTGRYDLGPLALEMGLARLRRLSPAKTASPLATSLAQHIDQAVALAIWGAHGATIVSLDEPSRPVHIVMRVGSSMSLLGTATGQVFLAYLPLSVVMRALEQQVDRLSVGFVQSKPNRAEIEAMRAEVRKRALARAVGAPVPGINAFSAPIFNHVGQIVMSITATGPSGVFDPRWTSPIAAEVKSCAQEISRKLGYDGAAFNL